MRTSAMVGAGILAVVVLAWFVSLAVGFDVVADVDHTRANLGPGTHAWLGTDHMGRDVFWRLVTASEAFVGPSLAAGVVTLLVALPAAGIAGYHGGIPAQAVRYIFTVLGSVPRFVMVLLACAIYGNETVVIAVAAGVAYAPALGEAVYTRLEALRTADFVDAARAHGVSPASILWYHLLWVSCRRLIGRHLLYLFGYYLLLETTLGYIGDFGVEEPAPSWGNMLAFEFGIPDGNVMAWVAPALAIWVTILGTVLTASNLSEGRRG